mgnify:CR=1 FL=1
MTFDLFWSAWPRSDRKGGKTQCLAKWKKLGLDDQSETIIAHVCYMKTTDQWKKDNGAFIPAPLVYLNQERWDGAEVPKEEEVVSQQYKDDAILKIEADRKNAVPMPEEIKKRLQELTRAIKVSV